jgi:hypothetical protein
LVASGFVDAVTAVVLGVNIFVASHVGVERIVIVGGILQTAWIAWWEI